MKFKSFEIRQYKDFDGNLIDDKYEVVKWENTYAGAEWLDNQSYCFVVAFIEYNDKEPCWEFRSVGTRFLEYYEEGLSQFILKYLELLDVSKNYEEEI